LDRLNESVIYEGFRKFLVKHLRVYNDDTIHVGEICNCLRKAYFNRKFGDLSLNHYNKTKYTILGLGLSTHVVLEEIFKELGFKVETPVKGEITIKNYRIKIVGTPDAFSDKFVVEIKTIKKLPEKPLHHHVMQLNAYLWMLQYSLGYIVYISKSDGYVKVFEQGFSENVHYDFIKRAVRFYEAIKFDKVPEKEKTPLCNYCEWKWCCYADKTKS